MPIPKIGFEYERITIPLVNILPVRKMGAPNRKVRRYKAILASIKEIGVIEPLMVYREKGSGGNYMLMDGHLRYQALLELEVHEVECLVATDDESFTYNARISRITSIQEHRMIAKAVANGVSPKRIASALHKKETEVKAMLNLLNGIHHEAVEILKDKQIAPTTIRIFRKVTAIRQIEMAEMMASANNFTKGYAEALHMGTPKEQLVKPDRPKKVPGMSPEEIARMELEMESLERDFKATEGIYGENMLKLTLAKGYLRNLLSNTKVKRYLRTNHCQVFEEFETLVAAEAL